MADSSSVFVNLGSIGGGVAVTTAGVFFNQGTDGPNGQAWWVYDGTNLQGNVPAGKGFAFSVNGTNQVTFGSTGAITASNGAGITLFTSSSVLGAAPAGNATGIANVSNRLAMYSAGGVLTAQGEAVAANPTNLNGQVEASHLAGGSAAFVAGDPASAGRVTIGLGAGTTSSGTAVTASGHDMAMRVGVTVNSTSTVSQPILLGSWAQNYNRPPFMNLTPGNAATAALAAATLPFAVTTTSGWSIIANTTGIPAGTYVWYAAGNVQ